MGIFRTWRARLPIRRRDVPVHRVATAPSRERRQPSPQPAAPPAPVDHARPAAVDTPRIRASLDRLGYRYFTDGDGDVCGLWDYRFFSFYVVRDQVLQVRGRWSRQAAIERLSEVLQIIDEWNRDHTFPKAYVRVHDDGRVHVSTEVSAPVRSGLSDDQLDLLLRVGLGAGKSVFDALDAAYPDPVLRSPEAPR